MNNAVNKDNILDQLDNIMAERLNSPSDKSYVSSCFEKGNDFLAKKLREETNELIEAVKIFKLNRKLQQKMKQDTH